MFLGFSLKNYKSFKDYAEINFTPTSSKELTTNIANLGKYKFLKTITIYGANASGKSNIIYALADFINLILTSATYSRKQKIEAYDPFYFDTKTKNAPIEFHLIFVLPELKIENTEYKNVKFDYFVKFVENEILEEILLFYPKQRKSLVFSRLGDDFKFGEYYKGDKNVIIRNLHKNQLFLSKSAQFYNKLLNEVYDYFENTIINPRQIPEINEIPFIKNTILQNSVKNLIDYVLPYALAVGLSDEDELMQKISVLVSAFDTGISSIRITEKTKKDFFSQLLGLNKELVTLHKNRQNEELEFDFERESSGTQWLFVISAFLVIVLERGGIFIIDEFEKNLHPNIVSFVVELFNNKLLNKKNAQLIFTTHNSEILEQKILRKDQIYLTEKNEFGESEVFSLSEFSELRQSNNIKDWYLGGKFGAIPVIDKYSIFKLYAKE